MSVGGLFLVADTPFELLSELQITLTLPDSRRSATLGARVVHALSAQRAQSLGLIPGIGVQLERFDEQGLALMEELVAWARASDPRPRIGRIRNNASVDRSAIQHEPMLGFLLEYIDGKRDPEALAQELALDVDTIERMLAELNKLAVIELLPANSGAPRQPGQAATGGAAAASADNARKRPLPKALQEELSTLEERLPTADYYELLGVSPNVSPEQARDAFIARNAELHASIRPPAEAQRIDRVLGRLRDAANVLSHSDEKDEYNAYMERAEWLKAAEAMRSRLSMPPASETHEAASQPPTAKQRARPSLPPASETQAAASQPPTAKQRARLSLPPASEIHEAASQPPAAKHSARLSLPPASETHEAASQPPAAKHIARLRAARAAANESQPMPARASSPEVSLRAPRLPSMPPPAAEHGPDLPRPRRASLPPAKRPQPSAAESVDPAARKPSMPPAEAAKPSQPAAAPHTARLHAARGRLASMRPPSGPKKDAPGAAAQILAQAEAAFAAGQTSEASRSLTLLSAMTFDDPRIKARLDNLELKVMRAAAVDFEKQAAYEEKHQRWGLAAASWLRVAKGRPNDSYPLHRAAFAQLQAGEELRLVMETAKRAVELSPNDAQAHRTLAKVYIAADMQASARRELELAQRCSATGETHAQDDAKAAGLLQRLLGRDDED